MLTLLQAALNLCVWFNASVTSWKRTEARNARLGGHPNSLHVQGLAVDIAYEGARPDEAILQQWLNEQGLEMLRETDHDHIQIRTPESLAKRSYSSAHHA